MMPNMDAIKEHKLKSKSHPPPLPQDMKLRV